MSTILHSKPRDLFPGDTMRILTRDAESVNGTYYYAGTAYQPQSFGHDNVRGADYQDIHVPGQGRDARFLAWHYAIVDDITPNRATVTKLLSDRDSALAAPRTSGGSTKAVRSLRPMSVGERIWIRTLAHGVEVM